MRNIGKIKELGIKLPYGARIKISKASGVSRSLVTQFFLGTKTPSNKTVKKILKSAAEVLEEYQRESHDIDMIVDDIDI